MSGCDFRSSGMKEGSGAGKKQALGKILLRSVWEVDRGWTAGRKPVNSFVGKEERNCKGSGAGPQSGGCVLRSLSSLVGAPGVWWAEEGPGWLCGRHMGS